jgi:hypothetical protein
VADQNDVMSDSFNPRGAARVTTERMKVNKVTPIYIVDRIEPALPFWASLGFEKLVEVPHEGTIGFVILATEGREVMLQTRASVKADLAVKDLDPPCALYMDVNSIASARDACKGARVLVEDRSTPYGARETWVLDPSGTLVGFAQLKKA